MASQNKRRRDSDVHMVVEATVDTVPEYPATEIGPPSKKQSKSRSLFVRSLPSTTTTESLIAHFSESFPIKHATAVIDPATKNCKGYGFVTFADAEDAERALQDFNGKNFQGRKLKIEIAERRQRDVEDSIPGAIAAGEAKPRSVPSAVAVEAKAKRAKEQKEAFRPPKLIVRNLPWSIKKPEQLAELFRAYGKVKHATIPSKKPGLLAGFGFVVLRGKQNAEKALEGVNGKEVDGRTLAVDWAVEKEVWTGKGGPGEIDAVQDEAGIGHYFVAEGKESIAQEDGEEDGDELQPSDCEVDEDQDDESDNSMLDDDELEGDEEEMARQQQRDTSTTLFIRNLPFTASDESLQEHFSQFGAIRYARIVLDHNTERPKGTGFVAFYKPEEALQCLKDAPRFTRMDASKSKNNFNPAAPPHSILQNEADDPSGKYTMEGRVLSVTKAVDKNEAVRLTEEGVAYRGDRDKDRRRLYLLSEGTISSKSPLYDTLSPAEIAMREASNKQRKTLIQSNPSLHLSLTRLSVRNIPRSITSKDLKALAREAIVGFATDVKAGKRQRLSKEELARGGADMIEAEKSRKKRGVGIVKQAKVVFEGREGAKVAEDSGAGRSRGYGFVEYYSHRSALMGLRWLNGHAIDYKTRTANGKSKVGREELQERKKRLVVEFAIENAQVVHRRQDREVKARERPEGKGHEREMRKDVENGKQPELFTTTDNAAPVGNASRGKKRPVSAMEKDELAENVNGKEGEKDERNAKRQRIIAKKRNMRRERKKTG